jgi:glutamate racemase
LACTHYPAASPWFAAALPDALLIDPAERMATAIADRHPGTRSAARPANRVFLTTGDPEGMQLGAARAWGTELVATGVSAGAEPLYRRSAA